MWSAWGGEAWGGQGEDRGPPSPAVSAGVALGIWGPGLLGPTGAPARGGAPQAVSVAGLRRGSRVRLCVKPCGAPGRGAVREVGGEHVQGLSADPPPRSLQWCLGPWGFRGSMLCRVVRRVAQRRASSVLPLLTASCSGLPGPCCERACWAFRKASPSAVPCKNEITEAT